MNSALKNVLLEIYNQPRSVFSLNFLRQLLRDFNLKALTQTLNYHVRAGHLLNPRKSFYAKLNYEPQELANCLYAPSYISLETILARAGVIFQYDSAITLASYISRELEIDGNAFRYRKMKFELLAQTMGLEFLPNGVTQATPERAFLDVLYLNSQCAFDNLKPLNYAKIKAILPIYHSPKLRSRAAKFFEK